MERGEEPWCDKANKLINFSIQNHLHVEPTWLPCIWLICKLPNKGLLGMPFMWFRGGDKIFRTLEKLMVYLGHRHYRAKGHPYGRDCVNAQWTSETYAYPIWSWFFKEGKRAWNMANYENTCITILGWTIHTHGVKRNF